MDYIENFIILKKGKFREYDLWLKVFSPNKGLQTYFAFGGLKSKRRFCGCLDILNILCGKIENKKKGYYILQEASLIENFSLIKQDKKKIVVVVNSLNFLEKIRISQEEFKQVYLFLKDFLYSIEETEDISFFPLLFKTCLIFNLGYLPLFDSCLKCKRNIMWEKETFFSFKDGGFFCMYCKKDNFIRVPIATLKTLKTIAFSTPKDWIKWNLDVNLKHTCYEIVNNFSQYHLQLAI